MIVGVNKYKLAHEDRMETREIDNSAVRESQIVRLKQSAQRATRRPSTALDALTESARTGDGKPTRPDRCRCPPAHHVGEVSDALEKIWGRFRAVGQVISGSLRRGV